MLTNLLQLSRPKGPWDPEEYPEPPRGEFNIWTGVFWTGVFIATLAVWYIVIRAVVLWLTGN